jgi:PAS domain S-box-containing protein
VDRELRDAMEGVVHRSLAPATAIVGVMSLVFAVVDAITRPVEVRRAIVLIDFFSGGAYLALSYICRHRFARGAANAGAATFVLIAVVSLTCIFYVDRTSTPLAFFGLAALGTGMLFLSWPWLVSALALVFAASMLASTWVHGADMLMTAYFTLGASGVAMAIHAMRHRMYRSDVAAAVALRESEERFRRLAEAASEAMAIHVEGRIVEVNEAFETMFGYTRGELVGKSVLDLAAPGARQTVIDAVASGKAQPYEAEGLRKDGTTFPGRLRGSPIRYHGRAARITAILDLTEERRAQAEARRRYEVQAHLEKLATLGGLSAGVAHEVNNPLAFMSAETQLFLSDLEALPEADLPGGWKERAVAFGQLNKEGIDRIARIVDALSLLSRAREATEPTELEPTVRATVALAASRMRGHVLELDVPAGLAVRAGADALGQVLLNLLMNAGDAVPAKGGRIRVGAQRQDDGIVRIVVEDNGPGIPADVRAQLFTPFVTTKPNGSGLGLSISRRIAEECGGALRFEDREEGGTRFVLTLPAAEHAPLSEEELLDSISR